MKGAGGRAPPRILTRPRKLALLGVVAVAFAAAAVVVPTYDLTDADKAEAVRRVVAWVVENKPLSGSAAAYPDAASMATRTRFYVVCDFLPEDAAVSDDPRVRRISSAEYRERTAKDLPGEGIDYLVIEASHEGDSPFALEMSNVFGPLAGHGYRFEFRKKLWGVQTSAQFLWVA